MDASENDEMAKKTENVQQEDNREECIREDEMARKPEKV